MNISFTRSGWDDLSYWIKQDRKTTNKIMKLLDAISRDPYAGVGKPEKLRHDLAGYWSRRIDQEHRIVYRIDEENDTCIVISCRHHY